MSNNYKFLKNKSRPVLRTLLVTALISGGFFSALQAQVVINHPVANGATGDYTTTWTVPANVSAITIEAWGGGAGASYYNSTTLDKGGQGGGYAKEVNYPVTPGDMLYISVGGGGQAGSHCGGNSFVSIGGNLVVRALGGAFFFVNCVCYQYYIYPGTNCTSDLPVNQLEAGEATNTVVGGNAGGMAAGGGAGGLPPGGNGKVPGGGAASDVGSRQGASGRVKINYVLTGLESETRQAPFHIYPNTATGQYLITFDGQNEKQKDIFVYDLTGKMVYENRSTNASALNIDLSKNTKGLYFVKVISEGKVYMNRLAYM